MYDKFDKTENYATVFLTLTDFSPISTNFVTVHP